MIILIPLQILESKFKFYKYHDVTTNDKAIRHRT